MKVVNKTEYSTRELKLIFHQVVRDLLKKRPSWAPGWKRYGGDYIVKTSNRRQDSWLTGHATIGLDPVWWSRTGKRCHNMHLSIPADVPASYVAGVFEHELYHAFGVHSHADMPDVVQHCNKTHAQRWGHIAEQLGLPERLSHVVKATKPRATKEELQLGRIEKLLEREKSWVTKQRRTETALKKIRKSLKHYEREGHSVEGLRVAANRKRGA
jgi:hypothetical protein